MPDSELVKLSEKFVMQRIILATPGGNNSLPSSCALGRVKGVSNWVNGKERVLEFDDLRFFGLKGNSDGMSILFEEGSVIDFTHCIKPRNPCQFRPENKFWLLKSIKFIFQQVSKGQINVDCRIDLVQVIRSTKLQSRREPWVTEALQNLIEKGVPEKEVKSKDTCFLLVSTDWPRLPIDAIIYDWNRIYEVVCFNKVSKVAARRETVSSEQNFLSLIAFNYGIVDEEPD